MRIAEAQLVRAVGELSKEKAMSSAELSQAVVSFLRRKRLSRRLGKVARSLDRYAEEESGTILATVTTARPLSALEQAEIEREAPNLLGKPMTNVSLTFREDPSLLGGLRIETSDTRYDSSLSRALTELHKSL